MRWHTLFFLIILSTPSAGQIGAPQSPGQLPRAQPVPLSGKPQIGSVVPQQTPTPGATNSVNTINPSVQVQGAYQGSVPAGTSTSTPLALSLEDAVKRGIQYNLGSVTASDATRQARALRLAALAELLPDLTGNVRETVQQIDLAITGLRLNLPLPGFRFPAIVGPFNYFDTRANFTESLSVTGVRNWQASRENLSSSEFNIQDSRDLVAFAVAGTYLQILASAARILTANAQIETSRAVYTQAVDRNRSGLIAHIDVSRSLVELQTQQQRLTSLTNDFEKQKLTLARLIGLPMAQPFTLSDAIPYREMPPVDIAALIHTAISARHDVQAAAAQVKAAELSRKAAVAEHLPFLDVAADYGITGINPSQSHGTFAVTGSVRFPIYRSGRIRADIEQADAALSQRRAEYEDTKARAEQDVRNAVLDLNAASQQVRVAESNRGLAAETLQQSRDRFRAGVTDTVELVQAQESVATAEQDFISALFAFNLARVALARATAQTEQGVTRLLRER
uniref:Outer membrane efflux protein n=1 Tax=Solibacter usitatus (strain Ellin6076) TaxID=234267 RepID=Q024G3_SOLUE